MREKKAIRKRNQEKRSKEYNGDDAQDGAATERSREYAPFHIRIPAEAILSFVFFSFIYPCHPFLSVSSPWFPFTTSGRRKPSG
jgi:hypothetical protein